MAYNQTRIKQFRRCQKMYAFRYDYAEKFGGEPGQELVPSVTKQALYRGTWLHALIEAHNRQWAGLDDDWEDVHEDFTLEFGAIFEEEREELGDLPRECERIFRSYLRFWQDDEDRVSVARLHDETPAVEFVVEVPLDRWGISDPFKGRIDLMVNDAEYGGLWVWDHKWVKRVPSSDERMMNPQSSMYVWALRKSGYDVRGFLNNYGRTKAPTIPRVLKNGTLSVAKNIDTDRLTYLRAIKDLHGKRWKQYASHVYDEKLEELQGREALWFRRERFPVETDQIKQALSEFLVTVRQIGRRQKNHAPRTYTYQCKFGCDYHDLCVSEFAGLDIEPLIEKKFIFEEARYGAKEEDLLRD